MPDETQNQQGIFEPKQITYKNVPLSGAQKALRLGIVLIVLVLAAFLWLLLRNPFLKPIKKYYRGLEQDDPAAMTAVFPEWLQYAKVSEDAMTVYDMCTAVTSYHKLAYGLNAEIEPGLVSKTAIEEAKLSQLQSGISERYGVDVQIKKGVSCELNIHIQKADGTEYTETRDVNVYKIDGKWVLLDVISADQ